MGKIRSTRQEAADQQAPVYAVAPEIEGVLVNWGRWAAVRVGGGRKARVNPLFREALRGHRWAPSQATHQPQVDVDQAWAVEQVVCDVEFSPRFRELLKQHYVLQAPPGLVCKLLHVIPRAYGHELWRSSNYFWARFTSAQSLGREVLRAGGLDGQRNPSLHSGLSSLSHPAE
jgi:hypothetical protein